MLPQVARRSSIGRAPETSYEAPGDLIAALAEEAADNDPGKWARLRKFRKAFSLADVLKVALACSDMAKTFVGDSDKAAKLRQKAMIYALLVNTGDRQGDLRLYRIGIDLVRNAEDDWCHGIRQGKTGKTKEVDALWPGTSALIDRHMLGNRPEWKVHIAMDTGTGDVRAVEFTSSRQGDSPLPPELLSHILRDELINTVTADGAYDTRRCHGAIIERGANGIIPVRRKDESGRTIVPRPPRETRSCAPPDGWAEHSGGNGRNTISEAGSRPE